MQLGDDGRVLVQQLDRKIERIRRGSGRHLLLRIVEFASSCVSNVAGAIHLAHGTGANGGIVYGPTRLPWERRTEERKDIRSAVSRCPVTASRHGYPTRTRRGSR
jgi:hypothetical protein